MRILLLGKDGQLGWELQRSLAPLGELHALGRADADLEQHEGLRHQVRALRPDVIVNAAAYTAVDQAEGDAARAARINAAAPAVLAQEAAAANAWLVHFSSDYVFDGAKAAPYLEDDATAPLSVYGRTKRDGEQLVRTALPRHLILRTSWVFSARGPNFARTMLRLASAGAPLRVVADQHGAPTSAELIADATALALYRIGTGGAGASGLAGTYHLTAGGSVSWHGYAQYVLELAREYGVLLHAEAADVQPVASADYPAAAARPRNSRLDTSRFRAAFQLRLPDWRFHVRRLIAELAAQGRENP